VAKGLGLDEKRLKVVDVLLRKILRGISEYTNYPPPLPFIQQLHTTEVSGGGGG
jgi:hypothetical protein